MLLIGIAELICILVFFSGCIKLFIAFFKKRSKKISVTMIVGSLVAVIVLSYLTEACFPEEIEASRIASEERRDQEKLEKAEKENQETEEENETSENNFEDIQTDNANTKENSDKINVEEKEIYNENGVSIVSKNVDVNRKSITFIFTISNSSDKDYSIAAHSYSVNGLMAGANLYGFGSVDVPAGKNAKLTIDLDNEWLKENGIKNISKLDAIFWAYYDSTKNWDTGIVSTYTNFTDEIYTPKGEEIYSDDNITVWKNEESNFTILNKSNYNSGYTIENCSVNNWSYDLTNYTFDLYNKDIHCNSYAVFTIPIDEEFLRDNDISEVKNFEFDILLSDSYWNYKGNLWEHKSGKMSIEL